MSRELVIVAPDDSLGVVSRALDSRRVGAALVLDDGNLMGIITERDVVRAVAVGAHLETSTAGDFMSRQLTTVSVDDEIGTAAEVMVRQRIRHLPVFEAGKLTGVLSLRDVVRWSLHQLGYDEAHPLIQLNDLSV